MEEITMGDTEKYGENILKAMEIRHEAHTRMMRNMRGDPSYAIADEDLQEIAELMGWDYALLEKEIKDTLDEGLIIEIAKEIHEDYPDESVDSIYEAQYEADLGDAYETYFDTTLRDKLNQAKYDYVKKYPDSEMAKEIIRQRDEYKAYKEEVAEERMEEESEFLG